MKHPVLFANAVSSVAMTRSQIAIKKANKAKLSSLRNALRKEEIVENWYLDAVDLPLSCTGNGEGMWFSCYNEDILVFNVGDKNWESITDFEFGNLVYEILDEDFQGWNIKEALKKVIGGSFNLPYSVKVGLDFYSLIDSKEGLDILKMVNIHFISYKSLQEYPLFRVEDMLKMGVTPEAIFNWKFKRAVSSLVTKKMKNSLITKQKGNIFGKVHSYRMTELQMEYRDLIPRAADCRINESECASLDIWAWVNDHVKWSNQSKVVHGPAGEERLLHNHQIISAMRDEHLVNGMKTSPSVIERLLEEEIRLKMEADLENNVSLPKLPLKEGTILPKGVWQLCSTNDLIDEGKRMQHCVGGYKYACLEGKSYIFHVETEFSHGATVEVAKIQGTWTVVQAMGVSNQPSALAKELIEEFVIPFIK